MTPERKAFLTAAKRSWRQRHPERHREAMRRYRQAKRFRRSLVSLGLSEADLMPWLEQVGKVHVSPWRARARDLWDAWQLLCEQQERKCFACRRSDVALVSVCRTVAGSVAGAVCGRCGAVLARDVL